MARVKRRMGMLAGVAFASGAMIGPGFFVLPGKAYGGAGPALVLAYAVAALLILPAVLSKCELVSAIPKTGGSYVFVDRGLGPLAATIVAAVDWVAAVLKAAFALEGVGALALLFLPWADETVGRLVAVCACLAIYAHFALGARLTALMLVSLVGFVLAAVLVYVLAALPRLQWSLLTDLPAGAWDASLSEAGAVCVAFGGVTSVVKIAGEFRRPRRTVPRALLLGFAVATSLYLVGVTLTVGVVERSRLAVSALPLAVGAEAVLGAPGLLLMELAGLTALLTAATTGIFAASLTLWAMARDGLAPGFFRQSGEPQAGSRAATRVTALAVALVCALVPLETLIKAASAMILLQLILVELSVLVLAKSGYPGYRPRFHVHGTPWLQLLAIVGYGVLLVRLGPGPMFETLVVVAVATTWYLVYVARRVRRDSALIHLVRRLSGTSLAPKEKELHTIALERRAPEDFLEERLDTALVLDLPDGLDSDALFLALARSLAQTVGQPAETIAASLQKREQEASTVVAPGIAVPHAVVPGSAVFCIAIARCRGGITFPGAGSGEAVHAALAIVCSEDMRHQHLLALTHIARCCSVPGFLPDWLRAPDVEELRELLAPHV